MLVENPWRLLDACYLLLKTFDVCDLVAVILGGFGMATAESWWFLQTVSFHQQLCEIVPALEIYCLRRYTFVLDTYPPSSQRGSMRLWVHSVMLVMPSPGTTPP